MRKLLKSKSVIGWIITSALTSIFISALLFSGGGLSVFGAWNTSLPANNTLLKDFPAQCRANWEAIQLGTDINLQVTNAKVASNASIADSKLATITTAGKVNATAIVGLPSMPAGAGVLPIANGGTASTTQNFVDISTTQASIGGAKTWTGLNAFNNITVNNATVAGNTTFSNYFPVTPSSAPTTNYQVANKKYVDDQTTGITNLGHLVAYTSNSTFTAPTGISVVYVSGAGGGGSGASGTGSTFGGGGGSGAYTFKTRLPVTAGNNYTVVVGKGGATATSGNPGNDGTASSFTGDSPYVVTINGGSGGARGSPGAGGAGGTSYTIGATSLQTFNGTTGESVANNGGAGACSPFGLGGARKTSDGAGNPAQGYGAGGGGGRYNSSATGGAGADGIIIVEY